MILVLDNYDSFVYNLALPARTGLCDRGREKRRRLGRRCRTDGTRGDRSVTGPLYAEAGGNFR